MSRTLAVSAMVWGAGCCSVSSSGGCLRTSTIQDVARQGDIDRLRGWLRDDRSWVREETLLASGAAGRSQLRPDMQAKLLDERERPWVRAAAARALGALGGGVDPDTLLSVGLAPGTPPELKLAIVDALCRVAPREGASRVAGLAEDVDPLVAAAAAKKADTQCARQP